MTGLDPRPDIQAVVADVRALEACLRRQGETFWADKVGRDADLIEHAMLRGLRQFLGNYGGSGSLNDLVLGDGRTVPKQENDQLDSLRLLAWESAAALLRRELADDPRKSPP